MRGFVRYFAGYERVVTDEILARLDRISQASGMVSVQAECTVDYALHLMVDRANVTRCTLDDIAVAVIGRSIRFGP